MSTDNYKVAIMSRDNPSEQFSNIIITGLVILSFPLKILRQFLNFPGPFNS